jgi:putative membrane protein
LIDLVIRVAINAIALVAAVTLVPDVKGPKDLAALVVVALFFGVINSYLKPIVKALSLPLNLFAFGLVGLVINTLLLMLLAALSASFNLGFALHGWPPGAIDAQVIVTALLASIVISFVSTVLALVRKLTPGM